MEDPETTSDQPLTREPDAAAKDRAAELIGRVISQRYRIVELLAMGGMGAVYRGEHLLLKKRLAIKVLHPETENLPELVTRFEREAIAGAHIQHANVAAATDFGKLEDGSFFLVLEYVRGNTLHHAMKAGRFEPQRAVNIARQIAAGLGAVHAMGIVHRDVKPRNVMLVGGETDVAKLIDFGLAKVSVDTIAESRRSIGEEERRARSRQNSEGDRLTDVDVIFGTIAYLAPEAAYGMEGVDDRADLYALGVILYEMLAGVHLFEATDPVELFKAQRYTPPPPFAERVPGLSVPAALEAVVMRLLEKDPAERYQTGAALIKALDEALAPPVAVPSTPPAQGDAPPDPVIEERVEEIEPAPSAPSPDSWSAATAEKVASLPSAVRAKMPIKAMAAAPQAKRRPPYFEAALLIGVAVVGLFMFTRLRFQPHTAPKPPPASYSSEPSEPGEPSEPNASLEPVSSASPDPVTLPSDTADPAGAPSGAPSGQPSGVSDALSGVDASGLRVLLSRAARTREWRDGEAALLALVERDPASFSRKEVVTAVREVVAGLEHDGQADKVFDALANRLGDDGLDTLYDIVQAKGGSRAAARAAELLRKDTVRARETPALRIAFELRDASCVDMLKLLDRAIQDGDARALMVLEAQGLACFRKSREIENAIARLKKKLAAR